MDGHASHSPDPVAVFRGLLLWKGERKRGEGKGKEAEGKDGNERRKGREGRG